MRPWTAITRREIALSIWWAHHGLPYVWAGDDPVAGPDCSGLMVEGLRGTGLVPRDQDLSAAGLAVRFRAKSIVGGEALDRPELIIPGCMLFWERRGPAGPYIGHVEAVLNVIDGVVFTIGASGGGAGHKIPKREEIESGKLDPVRELAMIRWRAIWDNALVKVRPATPGWVLAVDPFHPEPWPPPEALQ